MKNLFLLISFILLLQNFTAQAGLTKAVFTEDYKFFGLKDTENNVIVDAKYRKIIRLGDSAYLIQNKGYKYGIMDKSGNIIIAPKYRNAERVLGRYVKLGNSGDFGLYDETGKAVIPPQYDSLDILYGGMMLTSKNYYYGICDFNGKVLLENKFDDIYMPKPNIMRIQYQGKWYEIEHVKAETLTLPEDVSTIATDENFKVTNLVVNTGVVSGYSVLTFTDYLIKMFSSISPAHEATIDELMFSKGADTVNVLIKCTWLPKYPFVYAKNYYKTVRNPNNGPLSEVRTRLKQQIK